MNRKYLWLVLLVVLILIAIILASRKSTDNPGTPPGSGVSGTPLQVSGSGDLPTTNVDGQTLQQAAPPTNSATSAALTPQQALPYEGF